MSGGEMFGPRQGTLIDAMTFRIGSGLPMNKYDLAAAAWLAFVLGLDASLTPQLGRSGS